MRRRHAIRRLVAGLLWFLAGWSVGDVLSFVTGVDQALGPLLGGLGAAFVLTDPFHRLIQASRARSAGR